MLRPRTWCDLRLRAFSDSLGFMGVITCEKLREKVFTNRDVALSERGKASCIIRILTWEGNVIFIILVKDFLE